MSGSPSSKPACLVPWLSTFVAPDGTLRPCCVSKDVVGNTAAGDTAASVWNNEAYKSIRREILAGSMPKGCSSCRAKEELAGRSHRTQFAEIYAESGQTPPGAFPVDPPLDLFRLDFSFSNLCNLRCRFCGPWNSTRWIQDARELSRVKGLGFYVGAERKVKHGLRDFTELVDHSPRLSHLELKGGEPFLEPDLPAALEYLVARGKAKDITLQFSTNGTVIQPEMKRLLGSFRKVLMCVSVEATGELYRYLRGEAYDLDTVAENIRFYNEIETVSGEVHMALSAYSLFEPAPVQAWLSGLDCARFLTLNISPVVSSPQLNPAVLPRKFRALAGERLREHAFPKLRATGQYLREPAPLDAKPEEQARLLAKLKLFTRELDRIRGFSLAEAAPELAEMLFSSAGESYHLGDVSPAQ